MNGQKPIRPKRASKRSLRVWAAVAGAVAFALPWGVLRAAPTTIPSKPVVQIVTVPSGVRVTVQGPTGAPRVKVAPGGRSAGPAVAKTGGSHPVP